MKFLLLFIPAILAAASTTAETSRKNPDEVARWAFNNLHQLGAGAERYYLENNVTTVTYAELVGPGKIIGRLPPIAGEDYSSVVLRQGVAVVLTLPNGERIAADPQRSEGCTYAFHKVRQGDTADSIAARYGISGERLEALNRGVDLTRLRHSDAVRVK